VSRISAPALGLLTELIRRILHQVFHVAKLKGGQTSFWPQENPPHHVPLPDQGEEQGEGKASGQTMPLKKINGKLVELNDGSQTGPEFAEQTQREVDSRKEYRARQNPA